MENSKIEWCDHTFNPWVGCRAVSPGCKNCYAEAIVERFGKNFARRSRTKDWSGPVRWNKLSDRGFLISDLGAVEKRRPRVFCLSMGDWLDEAVPIEWLADLLKLMFETPNLDWLLLTKRPENWSGRLEVATMILEPTRPHSFADEMPSAWAMSQKWVFGVAPANVWIGTTVENQEMADRRIPELLRIPARVRFLSCEPLLGPIRIKDALRCDVPIHWVICGGESGRKKRKMDLEWARSLRAQCVGEGVAFFMKQIDKVQEIPADLMVREFPKSLTADFAESADGAKK